MVLLSVMRFVEDQQVNLFHGDIAVGKALVENFSSTDNDLVFSEQLNPLRFLPIFHAICPTYPCYLYCITYVSEARDRSIDKNMVPCDPNLSRVQRTVDTPM